MFGWEDTAYLIVKLCHTVEPMGEYEEGYNALDNHCEAVKFDHAYGTLEPEEFSYHWLELHLEEIESSIRLTQFNPDWRRPGIYFVNVFDAFNILHMGDVQRDEGCESSEDLSAEAFDELHQYPQDIGAGGDEGSNSDDSGGSRFD